GVRNTQVVIVGNPTGDLGGATADANNVKALFRDTYNVPQQDIQILVGSKQGTTDNVRQALNNAISRADADDQIVFWNAGHGDLDWQGDHEYRALYANGILEAG